MELAAPPVVANVKTSKRSGTRAKFWRRFCISLCCRGKEAAPLRRSLRRSAIAAAVHIDKSQIETRNITLHDQPHSQRALDTDVN